jgi:hypothetical protein
MLLLLSQKIKSPQFHDTISDFLWTLVVLTIHLVGGLIPDITRPKCKFGKVTITVAEHKIGLPQRG